MIKGNTIAILTVLSLLASIDCAALAFTQEGALWADVTDITNSDGQDVDIDNIDTSDCSMEWTEIPGTIKLDCDGNELFAAGEDFTIAWHMVYQDDESLEVTHKLDEDMVKEISCDGDSNVMFKVRVNCTINDTSIEDNALDNTRTFFSDLQGCQLTATNLWCNGPHQDSENALELCGNMEASSVQSIDYNLSAGTKGLEMILTLSDSRRRLII